MPFSFRRARRGALVAAAASVALLLSACSGGAAGSEGSPARSTITVDTLYGKVTVPAGAKRIVAFDFPEATALADLGVKPVGIGSYTPDLPAYTTFFAGVPVVTDSNADPVPEKVAATKPDLIIGDIFATDVEKYRALYQQLSAIAPTVILEWKQAAGNWPADAAGTAAAIGKTAQLDKLKRAYEKHAADIRTTYRKQLAAYTVDLVSANPNAWFLYGPNSSHGAVLAAAGARFAAAAGQKDGYVQYSPEKLDLLDHTGLIVLASASAESLTSNPVFQHLPATEAGHVARTQYFFPSSYRIADALLDSFADALKGLK